jgi:hypothetical protein
MKPYDDLTNLDMQNPEELDQGMVQPMIEEVPEKTPGIFASMMKKLRDSRNAAEAARLQKMEESKDGTDNFDPKVEELAKRNDPLYSQNSNDKLQDIDTRIALQQAIKDQTRKQPQQISSQIPEEIKTYLTKKSLPVAPKVDPTQSLPREPASVNITDEVVSVEAQPDMSLDELRKAQELAKTGQIMGMFSNISSNVAESNAPGFKSNRQFATDIQNVLGQEAKDIAGRQTFDKGQVGLESSKLDLSTEKELNDPNSSVSIQARSLAKEFLGSEVPANMTATQLNKLMGPIQQKAALEAKKEEAKQRSMDRANSLQIAKENKAATADIIRQDRLNKEAKLSDKQTQAFVDLDNAASDLDTMVSELGNNKNWVGPIDAKIPDLLVGKEQVAFRSAVGKYKDAYRKAITGAGAGPKEIAILESRLPTVSDSPDNFKAKILEAQKELRRRKQNLADNLAKQGKNVDEFRQGPVSTAQKQVVKKQYSKSRNQTKIVYSDGSEEILDGQQ